MGFGQRGCHHSVSSDSVLMDNPIQRHAQLDTMATAPPYSRGLNLDLDRASDGILYCAVRMVNVVL